MQNIQLISMCLRKFVHLITNQKPSRMRKITSLLTLVLFLASTMAFAQLEQSTGLAKMAKKEKAATEQQSVLSTDPIYHPGGASDPSDDDVLRWDDGTNDNSIGLTDGGTFHVSAYFTDAETGPYTGYRIDHVDVFTTTTNCGYMLKIYGEGTATEPGPLLHEQDFDGLVEDWVTVTLNADVFLDGEDLWVGYSVIDHVAGEFPAGVDPGPAVAGFGDMISLDGTTWQPLSELGLDYNWNIAAFLVPGVTYDNDLGTSAILAPTSGPNLGDEEVTATFKNYGDLAQSNYEVGYSVNGGAWVYETVATTLDPGATVDYTFGALADLSAYGDYDIDVCTFLAGDENPDNDCEMTTVTNFDPTGVCNYAVEMYDDWGDGWNGGVLDILADGNVIGTFELATGTGPETVEFEVTTGQLLEAVFTCGSWCYEISYYIYDHEGNQIFEDGVGGVDPTGGEIGIADCSTYAADVSVESVDMASFIAPGSVTPMATVKNNGTDTQTFDVTMTIDGYSSTMTVTGLPYGETEQVEFDSWNATVGGYTAEACTELAGDENPDNDCASMNITVQEMTIVYGYNAYDPSGGLVEGPVSFDLGNPGVLNLLAPTTSGDFIAGACWVDGQWYGSQYGGGLYTIDPNSGDMTFIGASADMSGLAYDGNTMYGVSVTDLYEVDMATGESTLIGPMGNPSGLMIGVAAGQAGELYGYDIGDDILYSIDKGTGAATAVGDLGFDFNYAQDMSFDKEANTLYLAGYTTTGSLYSVDHTTGAATFIGDFQGGAEVTGFAIPGAGITYTHNIGVQSIVAPESGYDLGMEDVVVNIKNYGEEAESGFDVYYTVDGAAMVTETYSGTIGAGETVEHTFGTQADLSAYGVYALEACTDLATDEYPDNDCATKEVENQQPAGFPYEDGFQSGGFEEGEWTFVPDQGNWQIEDLDGQPAPSAEFYWSPSTTGYEFSLTSPALPVPGDVENAVLKYDLMLDDYSSTSAEHITVELYDGNAWVELVDYDNGGGDMPWDNYQHDVTDLAVGNTVQFRFRAWGADTWDINWWRIDNVKLYEQVQVNFFGYVTEMATGDPIEGAEITVNGFTPVMSGADGYFELSFEGGMYDVSCTKEGYNAIMVEEFEIMEDTEWNPEMTAPTLDVNPTSVSITLNPGQTGSEFINVTNNGNGPLNWSGMFEFPEKTTSYPLYSDVIKDIKQKKVDAPVSSGLSDQKMYNDPIGPTVSFKDPTSTGYAYVAYDPSGQLENAPCSFILNEPGTITTFGSAAADFIATADIAMGTWYGVIYGGTFISIDMNSGEITTIGSTADMSGMTWDPTTQTMYGVDFSGGLYTVDLATGATTNVGTTQSSLIAMTCTNDGVLYGVDITNDEFGMIDKATGAWTVIGPVGFDASYAQDMATDRSTNTIYWAAYDAGAGQGQLMTVDAASGEPSLIGTFAGGSEITGFAIPGAAENWVIADPTSDMLEAGESTEVEFMFDATDLEIADIKNAIFNISSDPNVGTVAVDVQLTVGGTTTQDIDLPQGYLFASTHLIPGNPDMLNVLDPILGDNLEFVRNSAGQQVTKIGPNWVNNIGDWMTKEGYLFLMNGTETLTVEGEIMDPSSPIDIATGYSFIAYLPADPMNAMDAFETIMNDDLDFVRDSEGQQLRKIGPNWVNGIGDVYPGQGYLVKTQAAQELVYPPAAKSAPGNVSPETSYFAFEGGNPAEAVYTLYIDGNLEAGDEVAAFDGNKMVGATVITGEKFENDLPIFNELVSGEGYETGNPITLKVYDRSENTVANVSFSMTSEYNARTATTFPNGDGEFGIARVEKAAGMSNLAASIAIYPNPTNSVVTIEAPEAINSLRVYNYTGQVVVEKVATDANVEINVENFDSGIYVVEIETTSGIVTKKLTIQ